MGLENGILLAWHRKRIENVKRNASIDKIDNNDDNRLHKGRGNSHERGGI